MRTKLATFLLALILLFSMSIPALAYEVNVTEWGKGVGICW